MGNTPPKSEDPELITPLRGTQERSFLLEDHPLDDFSSNNFQPITGEKESDGGSPKKSRKLRRGRSRSTYQFFLAT
eukprot:UN17237